MPAKSKQQQKFMGLVHAFKKGEVPASKVSQAVKKAAKSMTKKSVKKYAKTDHDDLPVKVKEETKRDYKDEYKKFQSSKKSKKYRAELNKYNRQKGTYGNGDGKDASHKGGKIVGFESQSKNRGRAEKSRLKKEAILNEIPGSVMSAIQTATIKNSKTGRTNKMSTALADKDHPGHKKAKGFFSKLMDKVKGKKKDDKKKGDKKMSDADAKAQAKAMGISFRTGNELSKTEAVSKLREYVRGEIRKSLGKSTNEGYSLRDVGLSPFYKKLSDPQKQAVSIALVMGGNMTGAVKAIEKIKKGLSKDKKVKNALKLANESIVEGIFGKFDTGAGFKGNGMTVYDRNQEKAGDYKDIAHIAPNGKITIYDKKVKKEPKLMQSLNKISQEFKKTFKESVNEGLLKEDVEDLKKIVKELEGASKMHLGQSKRIQAHLDSMNVDETSNANLRGEDRIKMLVRSGSINNKGSYKLKNNKLNVIGIRPRDKGFFVNQLTKNTGIRKANLYYDGVHWKDGNKKF
jgi:hypothetical protein